MGFNIYVTIYCKDEASLTNQYYGIQHLRDHISQGSSFVHPNEQLSPAAYLGSYRQVWFHWMVWWMWMIDRWLYECGLYGYEWRCHREWMMFGNMNVGYMCVGVDVSDMSQRMNDVWLSIWTWVTCVCVDDCYKYLYLVNRWKDWNEWILWS